MRIPTVAFAVSIVCAAALSQTAPPQTLLAQLQSPDEGTRFTAFEQLKQSPDALAQLPVQRALVGLLLTEEAHWNDPGERDGEGFGYYISDVADLVLKYAESSGDSVAWSALLHSSFIPLSEFSQVLALNVPPSEMLAALGSANTDVGFRVEYLGVIATALLLDEQTPADKNRVLTDSDRRALKAALVQALSDPDVSVRRQAQDEVEMIGGPEDATFLRTAAAVDPDADARRMAGFGAARMADKPAWSGQAITLAQMLQYAKTGTDAERLQAVKTIRGTLTVDEIQPRARPALLSNSERM